MTLQRNVPVTINGVPRELLAATNETLLDCLRRQGYFEVKSGCEKGDCGACAVQIDGEAVDSCLTLTWTVEGLNGTHKPHPLITAFIEQGAVQCGYCTPGIIVAAEAMLRKTPDPTDEDIALALSGNLCRCTGYTKIFAAIRHAATVLRECSAND